MYLERRAQLRGFVETQLVERSGSAQRAVLIVECSVDDPERFGYFNGAWYKLEQTDTPPVPQPKRIEFTDLSGTHTMVECSEDDEYLLLQIDGTSYKLDRH